MFAITCPHHGARTLASTDDIRSYENTDHGIVLEVECWCGGIVTVVTGRTAPQPTPDRELATCGSAA